MWIPWNKHITKHLSIPNTLGIFVMRMEGVWRTI